MTEAERADACRDLYRRAKRIWPDLDWAKRPLSRTAAQAAGLPVPPLPEWKPHAHD